MSCGSATTKNLVSHYIIPLYSCLAFLLYILSKLFFVDNNLILYLSYFFLLPSTYVCYYTRRITSGTLKGLCSHPLFQRGRRSLLLQCSNNSESNSILPPSSVMPMRSSVMYNTRKNSTSENHIKNMMIKYGRAYNKQVKNNGNGIHTNNSSTNAPSSTSAPSSRSRNICGVDYYDNQSNDINNSINSTNGNFKATAADAAVDATTAMVIGNSNDVNLLHDNKQQNNNIAVNAIDEIMTKEKKEDDNNNRGSRIHSSSSNINNVNVNNNNDEKMMNDNNNDNNGNNYDDEQDDNENNQQDEGEDEDDDCQHDYEKSQPLIHPLWR